MYIINEYNGVKIDKSYFDAQDIENLFRLIKVLFIEEKIIISFEESINIWAKYSDDLCASWQDFPENDEQILKYIKSSDFFTSFEEYVKR